MIGPRLGVFDSRSSVSRVDDICRCRRCETASILHFESGRYVTHSRRRRCSLRSFGVYQRTWMWRDEVKVKASIRIIAILIERILTERYGIDDDRKRRHGERVKRRASHAEISPRAYRLVRIVRVVRETRGTLVETPEIGNYGFCALRFSHHASRGNGRIVESDRLLSTPATRVT